MDTLDLRRRFFAEELEAVSRLRTPALVEAFATVPREQFLPPGPSTAVYSAVGIRDEAMNPVVGKALMAGPAAWQSVKRLRRDAHEPGPACWLHGPTCCWSS